MTKKINTDNINLDKNGLYFERSKLKLLELSELSADEPLQGPLKDR